MEDFKTVILYIATREVENIRRRVEGDDLSIDKIVENVQFYLLYKN